MLKEQAEKRAATCPSNWSCLAMYFKIPFILIQKYEEISYFVSNEIELSIIQSVAFPDTPTHFSFALFMRDDFRPFFSTILPSIVNLAALATTSATHPQPGRDGVNSSLCPLCPMGLQLGSPSPSCGFYCSLHGTSSKISPQGGNKPVSCPLCLTGTFWPASGHVLIPATRVVRGEGP